MNVLRSLFYIQKLCDRLEDQQKDAEMQVFGGGRGAAPGHGPQGDEGLYITFNDERY